MSKNPFGPFGQQPQQRPAGFDTFGSNTRNANRPSGWTFGSSTPSPTGSFDTAHGSFPRTSGWGNVASPFGLTGFGGGSFGSSATKTGFGTGTSPGTAKFGSNAWTGFRTPTTSIFGAPSQPFGGSGWGSPAMDTSKQPFSPFVECELGSRQRSSYQNLCFQGPYKEFSQEELRLADYALGHRYGVSFGFGSSSFGTGFGTPMRRSASGPPQSFGMGSQSGAFGTGLGAMASGATAFGSATASPFGQAKANGTFTWGQKSQGPNLSGIQPGYVGGARSSQGTFGASGSPGTKFIQQPLSSSALQASGTSWSSPFTFEPQGQQQTRGLTSSAEAQRPSTGGLSTGFTFGTTTTSPAPNPFALQPTAAPSTTSQTPWFTGGGATTQAGQRATHFPSTGISVGQIQVPQSFGQQSQYGQTGMARSEVFGRPTFTSGDAMLVQQQPQAAGFATSPPGLVAKIDDITAYGRPWLFLTAEEKQQLQYQGPLAVRQASKGKPRSRSVPPGFTFRHPRFVSRQILSKSSGSGFRYGSCTSSDRVGRSQSSNWMRPPDLGRQPIESMSTSGSGQHLTSESTPSISSHTEGSGTVEKTLSQTSRQLKTLDINKGQDKNLFSVLPKCKDQAKDVDTVTPTRVVVDERQLQPLDPGRETGAKSETLGTTTESNQHASSPPPVVRLNSQTDVDQNMEITTRQPIPVGEYWMRPTKEDILAMDKDKRKGVVGLTIGRENVGTIRFKAPVDFTVIDLESLLGGLVILESRSATVYPDSVKKPPIGEGLNVPASISLEHSWPRRMTKGRGPSEAETKHQVASHIERLKRVEGTTFESYSEEDGIWTFSVNHFSTYKQVTCDS